MKHDDIWRALDTLAAENGLSASGLAKRSGLDPTTFNRSKRRMPDGRARWPSTESVAKVLDATGASLEAFTALVSGARALASNGAARNARAAHPADRLRPGWRRGFLRRWRLPGRRRLGRSDAAGDRRSQRLCLGDQRRFHGAGVPRRRHGDRLASRTDPPRRPCGGSHHARGGDDQAACPALRPPRRACAASIRLTPTYTFDLAEVAWMHRIIWASQ